MPQTVGVNEELARATTRRLVGRLEGVVFLVQGMAIAVSANVDKLLPDGRLILLGLAAAHAVVGLIVLRIGGPFRWGGLATLLWFGLVIAMPLVIAHLVAPTEYAASPACVQLCTYPAPVALLFAFYPWMGLRYARFRHVVEPVMLVMIIVEPLLLVLALRGRPTETNLSSVAASAIGVLLGSVVGKTVGRMCRTAARSQLELQDVLHLEHLRERDAYHDQNYRFLHSHAKGLLFALRNRLGPDAPEIAALEDFDRAVWRRREEMSLDLEHVPLDQYFEEHIRRFEHVIAASPHVGLTTAVPSAARLIDRALGDLITNAAQHGERVSVSFEVGEDDVAVLDIVDDGPGFDGAALDDPATSLGQLRRDTRGLGGDLVRLDAAPRGSRLRLTVPLIPRPRQATDGVRR